MKPKIVAILSVLLSFVFGVCVGMFVDRIALRPELLPRPKIRPDLMHGRIVRHFTNALDLTPAQKEQLERILEARRREFMTLRQSFRPQFERIQTSLQGDIRKILTPEQQKKFDKMVRRFQERAQKGRPHQRK